MQEFKIYIKHAAELARVTEALARKINSVYILGKKGNITEVALALDNLEEAIKVLGL
ncbi:MAG: hypothetical protein QMC98_00835 [Candidatus Thermoplasmatota archaeon]|nr:hypothetical protein [Candidatus Thermoplasmatota archaeon]